MAAPVILAAMVQVVVTITVVLVEGLVLKVAVLD